MTENYEAINEMFGGVFGQTFKKEQQVPTRDYRCVKCKYPLEIIHAQTVDTNIRKLFFCKKNTCTHFGIITVVAQKVK